MTRTIVSAFFATAFLATSIAAANAGTKSTYYSYYGGTSTSYSSNSGGGKS